MISGEEVQTFEKMRLELEEAQEHIKKLEGRLAFNKITDKVVIEWQRRLDVKEAEIKKLREALFFYGNPESYHAIGIFPDRPSGPFANDTSEIKADSAWDDALGFYTGSHRHGAHARETLEEVWRDE